MALGWTPSKGKGEAKPPLEVPPTNNEERCKTEGCPNPVFSKGLCSSHYHKTRRAAQGAPQAPATPRPEITREMVMSATVVTMGMLGTFVDESFMPIDDKAKPLPHVEQAVNDMMPWMQVYGGALLKMLPWFGLGSAMITLAAPAFDPMCEVIAGVRKPRFARKGPGDIYTDAWKNHVAKQNANAKPPPQSNGAEKPAAGQTVVVVGTPAPTDEELSGDGGKATG